VGKNWLARIFLTFCILCQTAEGADFKLWLLGNHNSQESLSDEKIRLGSTIEMDLGQSTRVEQETLTQLGFDYCQDHNICLGLRYFNNTTYAETGYEAYGSFAYKASMNVTLVEQIAGPSFGYNGDWFYLGAVLISHYRYDLTYNFKTNNDEIASPIPDGEITLKTSGQIYQFAVMVGDDIKIGALLQYEDLVSETILTEDILGDTYENVEIARIKRFVHYLGIYTDFGF
jgi:hypothetical protein